MSTLYQKLKDDNLIKEEIVNYGQTKFVKFGYLEVTLKDKTKIKFRTHSFDLNAELPSLGIPNNKDQLGWIPIICHRFPNPNFLQLTTPTKLCQTCNCLDHIILYEDHYYSYKCKKLTDDNIKYVMSLLSDGFWITDSNIKLIK